MPRASHQPSEDQRETVECMAAAGIGEEIIARVLKIDPKTLRKHYRTELDTGQATANAKVVAALFRTAVHGTGKEAVTAQIFWVKTRLGWKETQALEVTGKNGGPVQTIGTQMTPQEAADAYARTLNGG